MNNYQADDVLSSEKNSTSSLSYSQSDLEATIVGDDINMDEMLEVQYLRAYDFSEDEEVTLEPAHVDAHEDAGSPDCDTASAAQEDVMARMMANNVSLNEFDDENTWNDEISVESVPQLPLIPYNCSKYSGKSFIWDFGSLTCQFILHTIPLFCIFRVSGFSGLHLKTI